MPQLVALDLAGGPLFVDALERCWAAGEAVWPVDQRLPGPARDALFVALAPGAVIEADGSRRRLSRGRSVETGDALVVATSGTTGAPRGVVLDHGAVAASAHATSVRLEVDPHRDRWLCCLPVAHIGGLALVARALLTGTPLEVHPGFDADAVLDAQRRGATLVSLVSTALFRLGEAAGAFRRIVLGGAVPPSDLATNVVTTYGLTESGSGVIYDGRPLDGVDVRIVDGEVCLRAPMLLRTYRDGNDPKDASGFLHTGDGGSLDEAGRLRVDGRLEDVIVTGGEKVWPTPVEEILARLDGVAEAAVAGVSDPEWGARVVAFLVCPDPARRPSLAAVREAVRAELAPWAAPKELVFLEAIPRTAIGKVRRGELASR